MPSGSESALLTYPVGMTSRLIGRCIYCGATDDLRTEHIIPKGLGGTDTLLAASCGSCATETSRVEQRVLRGSWGGFRWVLGTPSRRSNERPPTLPADVRRGQTWTTEELVPQEYTGAAAFPIFRLPPALVGDLDATLVWPAVPTILATGQGGVAADSPPKRAGGDGYRLPVTFDPTAIARMIAKIAHGYAVEFLGVDGFEPFLPDAILGKSDDVGRWVGSLDGSLFEESPNQGHRARVGNYKDSRLLIAGVHLFADAGTPEYLVVVGEMTGPAAEDAEAVFA